MPEMISIEKSSIVSGMIDIPGKYSGDVIVSYQGSSTLMWDKKNFEITFVESIHIDDNVSSMNRWHLKANSIDKSMIRNLICNDIWRHMTNQNHGIYGIPVELRINDEFYGAYTLNCPPDSSRYITYVNFDIDNQSTHYAAMDHLNFEVFEKEKWLRLDGHPSYTEEFIDATSTRNWSKFSLSNLAMMYIFLEATYNADVVKNNFQATYDDKFRNILSPYDCDAAFGLHWRGKLYENSENLSIFDLKSGNEFWKDFYDMHKYIVHQTWEDTKHIFSSDNISKLISAYQWDDATIRNEDDKWSTTKHHDDSSVNQILDWATIRYQFMEENYSINKMTTFI